MGPITRRWDLVDAVLLGEVVEMGEEVGHESEDLLRRLRRRERREAGEVGLRVEFGGGEGEGDWERAGRDSRGAGAGAGEREGGGAAKDRI